MLKINGTIELPYWTMRKSEYTGDIIFDETDRIVVKAKLTIDDEGNALYWAWKPASDWLGSERTKPDRRTHKIKVDSDIHTEKWTVDHAGENWKAVYWLGDGGYAGNKYELTTIRLSSCDNFQTVHIFIRYPHKYYGYRGEKAEMRHVNDYGIVNNRNPEELLKLWEENQP